MMAIYWLYQRDDQFMVALKINNEINYYTDIESLNKALESVQWLISFGDIKELSLVSSKGKSKYLNQFLYMDLSQELGNKTIEEIGFINQFDMNVKTIKDFCKVRVEICEFILDKREDYFENKLEIIKQFNLKPSLVSRTRANISAEVLGAVKQPNRANYLMYEISDKVPQNEIPERLIDFYESITKKYKNTLDNNLIKNRFKMTVAGLTHTYGFGGVHAAKEKYDKEGLFLHIDAKSFFTSIMVNNDFISSAIKEKHRVKELHDKKAIENKEAYKVVINAIVGSMNNPYSKLYDPRQYFSVTVNGQIIMTHLIVLLENFIEELVQTNTDGIIVKIEPAFEALVTEVSKMWAEYYEMEVKVTKVKRVIQRNVNNYMMITEDNEILKTGIYADDSFTNSSIPVIRDAIVECQLNGTKPQDYLVGRFKDGDIQDFYFIGSKTKDSDGLVQEVISGRNKDFKNVSSTVCGIATSNKRLGTIYQNKKGLHSKLTGCPDNFMSYMQATKKDINLSWYVEQVEKSLF